jgi:hypothetical protein
MVTAKAAVRSRLCQTVVGDGLTAQRFGITPGGRSVSVKVVDCMETAVVWAACPAHGRAVYGALWARVVASCSLITTPSLPAPWG